jgi:asparagine synthase (glutamine-hydrolysing)
MLSVARDAATISRKSVWSLIRAALRRRHQPSQWTPANAKHMNYFISADALQQLLGDVSYVTPPALRSAEGLPPGKLRHIDAMLTTMPFYWAIPQPNSPERLAPLFSQPIVELALRLPTYVLCHGGWDRAIERRAFEQDVPAPIIRRRSKGVSDDAARALTENNLEFVRELLLDGVLAREGVLDRKKLESFLCGSQTNGRMQFNELYAARISAEAWLRRWCAVERRPEAARIVSAQ